MKVVNVEPFATARVSGELYSIPIRVTLPEIPGLDFGKARQLVLAWAREAADEIELPSGGDDVEVEETSS